MNAVCEPGQSPQARHAAARRLRPAMSRASARRADRVAGGPMAAISSSTIASRAMFVPVQGPATGVGWGSFDGRSRQSVVGRPTLVNIMSLRLCAPRLQPLCENGTRPKRHGNPQTARLPRIHVRLSTAAIHRISAPLVNGAEKAPKHRACPLEKSGALQ